MAIKPGASIFHAKQSIDDRDLIADSGFAYRYRLNQSTLIYRIQDTILYEDGQQLNRTPDNVVVTSGSGSYAVSKSSEEAYYLYFSSSDNSNPITNNRAYTLYLPFSFVSRLKALVYLLILMPAIFGLLAFMLVIPEHRATLFSSPSGILKVLDLFFNQIETRLKYPLQGLWSLIKEKASFGKQLFTITILSAFLYTFFEWLFYITMPSFMSILSFSAKIEVFFLAGLIFSVICIAALVAFAIVEIIGALFRISRFTQYIGVLIPACILSVAALLLIDNFTYTLFKFGISTSTGVVRIAYAVVLIFLLIYIYYSLLKYLGMIGGKNLPQRPMKNASYFALGLLVISIGVAVVGFNPTKESTGDSISVSQSDTTLPNILLLGSDGVSAQNVSAYGYTRDTTPRLRELAQSSLVAVNNFPNSGNSPGSVISMFTSKLPTTTRLAFTPDILKGIDAFQHLPGILKTEGYSTYEMGVPLYVDSYAFNLQNGFDMVNGQYQKSNLLSNTVRNFGYETAAYFWGQLTDRASERILHIFFLRDMVNPYNLVMKPAETQSDRDKISQAMDLFDQTQSPLFIHIHLLGTHGDYFEIQNHVFSAGEEQDQPWMTDFYDDAILSFDNYIGEVVDHLKAIGKFDNTILIIYTDHAEKWQVNQRILLIIHFPGGVFTGKIIQNTQNMDIAPTILDYMGQQIPGWMAGNSLLSGNLDKNRLIFSAYAGKQTWDENHVWALDVNFYKPPFYQFDYININDCQKWYRLDLRQLGWTSGDIIGYPNPCSAEELLSFESIKQATADQLARDGFNISSLP